MRRHLYFLLSTFAAALCSISVFASTEEKPGPFVIPELKTWEAGKGAMTVSGTMRIAVPSGDEELLRIAGMLADDWKTMFGHLPGIVTEKGTEGDIVLEIKNDKRLDRLSGGSAESYSISITDRVRLSAATARGVFWGTQTILQMADRSIHGGARDIAVSLPCGKVLDWPDYGLRGFMMDCGRKYIPMSYLRKLTRIMAYYKMNTLQVHLNDNGFKQYFGGDWDRTYAAFRLECDTYPGLTARDGHYTKEEFIDFQEEASGMYVEIIPEIDVPAHSLALTRYKPEIGSQEYGMDHLDLFNPETYSFVDALFKEYLEGGEPVFRGPRVHIGTDEYSNKDQDVVWWRNSAISPTTISVWWRATASRRWSGEPSPTQTGRHP